MKYLPKQPASLTSQLCLRASKFLVIGLWAISALLHPRLRRPLDLTPLRLVVATAEASHDAGWHGTAILYDSSPLIEFLQMHWVERPILERAFRVNRPELLRKPKDSTLKTLVRLFAKEGFAVKELHVHVGAVTIVHFVS